ncbi:GNAT family N-acetyltransferase [Microlunatus elymi]|uniref:GNAT family N-acetyltransferase n=1 Tax=Microlunatus elymi TaxID=2596828 RepID=A0A516Q1U1_9ACTN|nr:GNAT family N-acetyltransferase [Microlunatus elymi]QDP97396.1 GNAT family N-acetyltransferase [Microlunatus elymi]
MYAFTFTDDPSRFLDEAGDHLAGEPVLNTVLMTNAERAVRERAEGVLPETGRPYWFVIIRRQSAVDHGDGVAGEVVGVAMRTAPHPPYPLWVQEMPDDAACELVGALHARGESIGGANGALPAARIVAEETARLAARTTRIASHTRLFELAELILPPQPHGRFRAAGVDDLELVNHWLTIFQREAAEQGSRPVGQEQEHDRDDTRRRIRGRRLWVWEDDGEIVHLTGGGPPSLGVARIGPVFTPKEHRGRGFAAATVALVSRHFVDAGARVCLFTDQANPVSNKIYQRIGYRPVADTVEYVID